MKRVLTKHEMACRAARELADGDVVNLGIGIPSLVSCYVPQGIRVTFHVENGAIGFGRVVNDRPDKMDYDLTNAGADFIEPLPGMAIVDFAEAFDAIRTGRVNVTILGAYQVSERGDLASWALGEDDRSRARVTLGGAMDMPIGPKRVIVAMTHVDKNGRPKLVRECSLPLTARRCVQLVITDIAVVQVTQEGFLLKEVAPGWTPPEVQRVTAAPLLVDANVREIDV